MKIGIDCQALENQQSGLGRYTEQLLSYFRPPTTGHEILSFKKPSKIGSRTYDRLIWENIYLPKVARKNKVDILHTPAFCMPYIKGRWKAIVTIHDLIGAKFPEHLSFASRCYWSQWLPYVNRKADLIIADSECTKKDIMELMKVPEHKIRVIYLAADKQFKPCPKNDSLARCEKYNIPQPYILFLGNVEPRKNLPRLIRSFSTLRRKNKIQHSLVIAGSRSWKYPEIDHVIRETETGAFIKFLNYVDEKDLVYLYNGADLFVYPSIYEGFGLPLLEAMQCGVPVLTSNVSSMPEVGGDAVFYINPSNEGELADGIYTILSNTAVMKKLREKGLEQIRKFNWEITAQQTLKAYETMG